MATLEGTVDHVVYANDETHYAVARIRPVAGGDLPLFGERAPTIVGTLPGIAEGQELTLQGDWVNDPRYGRQFRVQSFELRIPGTVEGIEAYLSSGLIKGVGPVMAHRLVETFGEQTLEVIARSPDRLLEVDGIGEGRATEIRRSFEAQSTVQNVMIFLHSHGITSAYATRIYKTYGDRAVEVVRGDPYRLADEVVGIGFKIADAIAARVGIDRHSPRRAEAGIVYVLGKASDDGHLFCEREVLLTRAEAELDIPRDVLEAVLPVLVMERRIVLEPLDDGATAVYPTWLFEAESRLAQSIAVLAMGSYDLAYEDASRLVARAEETLDLTLAEPQRQAVEAVLERKVVVITGGPGTGKTTILRGVVHVLIEQGLHVALCAPTGRAAKRLHEATGARAMTVHRLLEWSPRAHAFQRNEDEPLSADAVIVDEASMLDVPLADALVAAIPAHARLVLVGDIDQLPPVGPGSVLADIIRSDVATVIRLSHIFRQGARSAIVTNAHRINHGELPEPSEPGPDGAGDFHIIYKEDPHSILDVMERLLTRRIPEAFGLDAVDDIQILTPMHRSELGSEKINERFQALLNPTGTEIRRGGKLIRTGDKVMQIRNNYDKDVFNGDLGRVRSVDASSGEVVIRFEDRDVLYETSDLDEITLAYAVSVHKCVHGDTLVWTPGGLVPIRTLYPSDAEGDEVPISAIVHDGSRWSRADRAFRLPRQATWAFRTAHGFGLEGSERHPVAALDGAGAWVWKHLPDVVEGDRVAVVVGNELAEPARREVLDRLEAELANSAAAFTEDSGYTFRDRATAAWVHVALTGFGVLARREGTSIDVDRAAVARLRYAGLPAVRWVSDEVVAVGSGEAELYDIRVPSSERFVSGGILSHNSQGSEYPAVVLPLHTQHYMMLQRNLLYTAVTRGRKLVVVVGSKKALGLAVRRSEQATRASLLSDRIRRVMQAEGPYRG